MSTSQDTQRPHAVRPRGSKIASREGRISALPTGQAIRFTGDTARVVDDPYPGDPKGTQVVVRTIACTICGADTKVATGEKAVTTSLLGLVPGHEAVAEVTAVGEKVAGAKLGDLVVVLPHVPPADHETACEASAAGLHEHCVGRLHFQHIGFDCDGVLRTWIAMPQEQFVRIPDWVVEQLSAAAPDLPAAALAAHFEPLCCCLTARSRMLETGAQIGPDTRVLIIGNGHIGIHVGSVLAELGAEVWFKDLMPEREAIAVHSLGNGQAHRWTEGDVDFDVVVDCTGSKKAIKFGFHVLRRDGLFYGMAGLMREDRDARDPSRAVMLEAVHRDAVSVAIASRPGLSGYTLSGHSGLRRDLIPEALDFLGKHAAQLSRMTTGTVAGLSVSTIRSRSPLAPDVTPDTGPASLALLRGEKCTRAHVSPIIVQSGARRLS